MIFHCTLVNVPHDCLHYEFLSLLQIGVGHYFSPLKARKELGYVPLVDQKEAFKKTITYFKTRHAKDLKSPSLLWLILILPIYFGLFPSVLVPPPFLGFLEPVRFPWIFLLRSVQNMQILVIIVCLGHLLEACFAWLLARQLDPINKKGWFLQTLFWGFPSFMLILKRRKRKE
ncbi:hypothetical protein O6H91_04G130600 [Diphasiastrum complanatum]|uniref:Uncharacterized protein n=1 Tax=Diphasiastrum complanatum TaxID=34168 RepID=A0ACC2E1X2_DIPCM|nr:hypothetical protein O6H91_04G130600 [Diphasiastrum complanatum]